MMWSDLHLGEKVFGDKIFNRFFDRLGNFWIGFTKKIFSPKLRKSFVQIPLSESKSIKKGLASRSSKSLQKNVV